MILFIPKGHPLFERVAHPCLGRLVHPLTGDSSIELTASLGVPWCGDNGAWMRYDEAALHRHYARVAGLPGCRFLLVPDVVEDPAATLDRYLEWWPTVAETGQPIAYALQDGVTSADVPWREIDAVFVGGSTRWKLGPDAAQLVREAKQRGKWAHMGRVNTERRIAYAKAIGCDSIDGSGWARFTDIYLPRGLAACAAPAQERLIYD